jgi:cytochrome P450
MTTHLTRDDVRGVLPSDPVFDADRLDPGRPVLRDQYGVWVNSYPDVEAAMRSEHVTLDMATVPGFDPDQAHPTLVFMWATDTHVRPDGTPGRHHVWRELLQPWIGAPGVSARRALIHHVATSTVAALPPTFDAYDYATVTTVRIIADLVGLSPPEVTWLLDRQREHPTMLEVDDIPEQPQVVRFLDEVLQRPDHRGFLRAVRDSVLSPAERRAAIWGIVQAGTLAAAATIAGTVGLAVETGRWPLEPDAVPGAVEETIRFAAPFPVGHRFAIAPFELPSGARIEDGERLLLNLAAAGRDPRGSSAAGRAFGQDQPLDVWDPDRSPNPHLGWAVGPHRCTGAHLARAIVIASVTALAEGRPHLELAGPWQQRVGTEVVYVTSPLQTGRAR